MKYMVVSEAGEILRNIDVSESSAGDNAALNPSGRLVLGEGDELSQYLSPENIIMPRPSFELSVLVDSIPASIDGINISVGQVLRVENIPGGCSVVHPLGEQLVEDNFIEWSSLTAGEFELIFNFFPYQELIIDARVTE